MEIRYSSIGKLSKGAEREGMLSQQYDKELRWIVRGGRIEKGRLLNISNGELCQGGGY